MSGKAVEEVKASAWCVCAARHEGDAYKLLIRDEGNQFAAVRSGDGLLLLDEGGKSAWGVRRIFIVRRTMEGSWVYFDRGVDFAGGEEIGFRLLDGVEKLNVVEWGEFEVFLKGAGVDFAGLCAGVVEESEGARAYVRELLEALIGDDLLGPALGPEEEVHGEIHVRDRYILGRLGPRKVYEGGAGKGASADAGDADEQALKEEAVKSAAKDVGNREYIDREEAAKGLVGEGGDKADEEAEEDVEDAQDDLHSLTLVPSSMGLTFCIADDLPEVEVEVRWGQYVRQASEDPAYVNPKTGKPYLCWKRVPRGGTSVLKLAEGPIKGYCPDEVVEHVEVRGNVSRAVEDSTSRLVTLYLVNLQVEPEKNRDAAWLFQPEICVRSPNGEAIFQKRPLSGLSKEDPEMRGLEMIYRRKVEFAVGHNVSVHAEASKGDHEKAVEIRTVAIPHYEVPMTEVPGSSAGDRAVLREIAAGHLLDMRGIADEAERGGDLKAGVLGKLVRDYGKWIAEERRKAAEKEFDGYKPEVKYNLGKCERALERLEEGLKVLQDSREAREAFIFANRVMADQRVRSIISLRVRQGKVVTKEEEAAIDGEKANHEWRPFQIAFLLLAVPGLAKPGHADRTEMLESAADLLWFPTGGGKTEAYLGVAAFAMAIRRLQGKLGGYDGGRGLAVIMRYTLRLLTVQQFQRAATLLCAMELARKKDVEKWGSEPFTLGLWVGYQNTPNTFEQSAEALRAARDGNPRGASPVQLSTCPWCGAKIDPGEDAMTDAKTRQTKVFCSDAKCPFSGGKAEDGIPVKAVDEEMYHRPPSMMIATVDKFAMMAWRGETRALFGKVGSECARHGLILPDDKECNGNHKKVGAQGATRAQGIEPIRPPDLIIQDEFHLISGPLGTMVGLYETAVDELCTWELEGKKVHPKVIASTATVRMADDQIRRVFARQCSIFPPSGIDVEDNFFSVQRSVEEKSGRDYLGICALGISRPAALIRTYVAFLTAAQTLFEKFGRLADPYMTTVGYFNSLRELGGMRRLSEDDVQTRSVKMARDKRVKHPGLSARYIRCIDELTSRVNSREIPEKLGRLEIEFKKDWEKDDPRPIDIVLATNMLSVGVDVNRLGFMVVNGQPKNTAEYIQATSRVGRRYPGVVCTVLSWARPRDLSHYEMFEHYHATFYKHVEAQSVTPFAPRALDRGLTGAYVSAVRLKDAKLAPNLGAAEVKKADMDCVQGPKKVFVHRAQGVMQSNAVGEAMGQALQERIDDWVKEATQPGRTLGYDKSGAQGGTVANYLAKPSPAPWDIRTAPTSMREVESPVRLIMRLQTLPTGEREQEAHWEMQAPSKEGEGTIQEEEK